MIQLTKYFRAPSSFVPPNVYQPFLKCVCFFHTSLKTILPFVLSMVFGYIFFASFIAKSRSERSFFRFVFWSFSCWRMFSARESLGSYSQSGLSCSDSVTRIIHGMFASGLVDARRSVRASTPVCVQMI